MKINAVNADTTVLTNFKACIIHQIMYYMFSEYNGTKLKIKTKRELENCLMFGNLRNSIISDSYIYIWICEIKIVNLVGVELEWSQNILKMGDCIHSSA